MIRVASTVGQFDPGCCTRSLDLELVVRRPIRRRPPRLGAQKHDRGLDRDSGPTCTAGRRAAAVWEVAREGAVVRAAGIGGEVLVGPGEGRIIGAHREGDGAAIPVDGAAIPQHQMAATCIGAARDLATLTGADPVVAGVVGGARRAVGRALAVERGRRRALRRRLSVEGQRARAVERAPVARKRVHDRARRPGWRDEQRHRQHAHQREHHDTPPPPHTTPRPLYPTPRGHRRATIRAHAGGCTENPHWANRLARPA